VASQAFEIEKCEAGVASLQAVAQTRSAPPSMRLQPVGRDMIRPGGRGCAEAALFGQQPINLVKPGSRQGGFIYKRVKWARPLQQKIRITPGGKGGARNGSRLDLGHRSLAAA
jgi:hypothetical protein